MDKNTFTGLFLIMLIIAGSVYFLKPNDAEIQKEKERIHLDSLKKAGVAPKPAASNAAAAPIVPKVDSAALKAPFGASIVGSEQLIALENKDIKVKLSTRGGRVYSAELKKYKTFDKKPLILFDGEKNDFSAKFSAGSVAITTGDRYFTLVTDSSNAQGSVTLRLSYSPTQYIDYVYSLPKEGYKLDLTVKPIGLDGVVANSNTLNLTWAVNARKQEMDIHNERTYTYIGYFDTEKSYDFFGDTKDDQKEVNDKSLQWISFKQHFFSSVLLAKQGFTKSKFTVTTDTADHDHIKQLNAELALTKSADGTFPMQLYFSPNKFEILEAQGNSLEKQIYFGWGPLKYINRFGVLPVFHVLENFNWNYGMIILALTVILKLVLSPLTYKSYLSMAKMRVLKPEMDEIKGKVGEDNPTLLQQEYLKLYKKAGVNPLGGCLPLLLQMPIVIAFFKFFPSLFELRGESFLWMHDLSTYDAFIKFGFTIPFIGDHLSLMCVLMTISTLIYTYFNNQISGVTGQMKYIGYITPVIFLGALNSYPAGLNYYYFLANMFTFLQQYIIRLMVDDKKIHAKIQENKKKPESATKKKTGFAAKMEEMMRQQQVQTKKK